MTDSVNRGHSVLNACRVVFRDDEHEIPVVQNRLNTSFCRCWILKTDKKINKRNTKKRKNRFFFFWKWNSTTARDKGYFEMRCIAIRLQQDPLRSAQSYKPAVTSTDRDGVRRDRTRAYKAFAVHLDVDVSPLSRLPRSKFQSITAHGITVRYLFGRTSLLYVGYEYAGAEFSVFALQNHYAETVRVLKSKRNKYKWCPRRP